MSSAKDKANLACRIFGLLLNIPTLVIIIIAKQREDGNNEAVAAISLSLATNLFNTLPRHPSSALSRFSPPIVRLLFDFMSCALFVAAAVFFLLYKWCYSCETPVPNFDGISWAAFGTSILLGLFHVVMVGSGCLDACGVKDVREMEYEEDRRRVRFTV